MRIATYNVENLFSRVHAMNGDDPDKTSAVLADVAELQRLISAPLYSRLRKCGCSRFCENTRRPRRAGRSISRKRADLLVSDALWPRLQEVGIERRGIWAGAQKTRERFPPLASVTAETNAASDHAAGWADFDL